MAMNLSPIVAFTPSVFYDANHNPRNIPCEGPRVVPIMIHYDSSLPDNDYIINFNQLFQSGQMSCVQSMMVCANYLAASGGANIGFYGITFAGTGQYIQASVTSSDGIQVFDVCALNPCNVLIESQASSSTGSVVGDFPILFLNYTSPVIIQTI